MFSCVGVLLLLLLRSKFIRIKMKTYKTKEVIKLLEADGWFLCATRGDHRQYKHATKKGKVTVSGQLNKEMD